jgi:hypothetical protein
MNAGKSVKSGWDRVILVAGLVTSVLFLATAPLSAQVLDTGTLLGTVQDPSGAAVPDVTVRIIRVRPGFNRQEIKTNSAGDYLSPQNPAGEYRIEFEKEGFATLVHSGIQLSAGQSLRVDGGMSLGAVTQTVSVSAAVAQVDTATANIGSNVYASQINEIPLPTRQFTQFVVLQAGVSNQEPQEPGFASNGAVGFSFGGGITSSNNWLLDGGRNVDPFNGNILTYVDLDAISEMRMEREPYSVVYGRNAGAQINVISKSGSDTMHGSLFEFLRNEDLDSRSFFAPTRGEDRWNDFGGTFGGPIKKDKLFIFLSAEFRRILETTSTRTGIVPTQAQRSGDFGSTTIINPTTGQPFLNNQIPLGKLDPNAQILLADDFPLPNFQEGALNYTSSLPDGVHYKAFLGRLDYNITPSLSAALRYNLDSTVLDSPYGLFLGGCIPNIERSNQVDVTYIINGNLRWSISPTLLNQFTINWYRNTLPISTSPLGYRSNDPGLNIPRIFNTTTDSTGLIPGLEFAQGYAGFYWLWPEHIHGHTFEILDNVAYIKGRHSIDFGASIDNENKTQDNTPVYNNGQFTFDGGYTGSALADFELGDAYQYIEGSQHEKSNLNFTNVSLYAQDKFHVIPRLTFNYGVRWEYYPQETAVGGIGLSFFQSSAFSYAKAPTVLPNGSIVAGTQNFGNGIVLTGAKAPYGYSWAPNTHDTIEPRVGFAYELTKDSKTVLRGGFGKFFDRWSQWTVYGLSNWPYDITETIFNTELSNPGVGGQGYFPEYFTNAAVPWKVPYMLRYSLGVQRQLPANVLLEVDYVGSHGGHLVRSVDENQGLPSVAAAEGTVSVNYLRPYTGFAGISTFQTDANSNYNSLQVEVTRRFGAGLSLQSSYTWSKSTDDTSTPQNSYGPRSLSWGLSGFDRTHTFVTSYVWDIPIGRKATGWQRQVIGGWQLSGITTFQSGDPFSIGGVDWAGVGNGQRPNLVGKLTRPKTKTEWFDPSVFAAPALGTWGDSGVDIVRGPGMNNWDIDISKHFRLTERANLEFRSEFYNVWNHTQWSAVNGSFGSGAIGQVDGTLLPRRIQFGLHLRF